MLWSHYPGDEDLNPGCIRKVIQHKPMTKYFIWVTHCGDLWRKKQLKECFYPIVKTKRGVWKTKSAALRRSVRWAQSGQTTKHRQDGRIMSCWGDNTLSAQNFFPNEVSDSSQSSQEVSRGDEKLSSVQENSCESQRHSN